MSRSNAYSQYYKQQQQLGGDFPIFRGGQHGGGLGDILRGVFRWLAPMALRGVSAFTGNLMQERDKGATWADAAKSSVGHTLGAMGESFVKRGAQPQESQSGGSALFTGEQGVPYAIGYKSRKRKAQSSKSKKSKKSGKKRRIVDTNY